MAEMNLNRITAFIGKTFYPFVGKAIYKKTRAKKIEPISPVKLSEISKSYMGDINIVAHRGFSGQFPENSLPAFKAAVDKGGYAGIECDTHMSADGVWMVAHDADVSTIFNGEGLIPELNSEDMLKMTMKNGANLERMPNTTMCTLQQYIDILKTDGSVMPVIEVKDKRPETMKSFYELLKKNDLAGKDKCIIISFIIEDLIELKKIDEDLTLWTLVDYLTDKNIEETVKNGFDGIDFSCEYNAPRPEYIKKIVDKGLACACWTCDTPKMARKMVDAGVKYLTSNCIISE